MAKVLSGYRGIGQQTSSGVFRDMSPTVTDGGSISMSQSATTANEGNDPQGVEFIVGVRMADQTIEANRDHIEYMIASYDLSGGVYTWNRVSTIESSNGGASIDWASLDGSNNSLIFYAITPHTLFNKEDYRYVGDVGNPAFENSWENYSTGWVSASFRKHGNRVTVRGLVKQDPAVVGSVIFTLPEGYRPIKEHLFASVSGSTDQCRVRVSSAGEIRTTGAIPDYVGLNLEFDID